MYSNITHTAHQHNQPPPPLTRFHITKHQFAPTTIQQERLAIGAKVHKLTTGCEVIDSVLGGGIRSSDGIVEICSEAGCGKSQLAMQLCLHAQLPGYCGGLEGGCMYINTESSFSAQRLAEMADEMAKRHSWIHERTTVHNDDGTAESTYDWLEYIYIKSAPTVDELEKVITVDIVQLLSEIEKSPTANYMPIKLIVIDSIAAPFRGDRQDTTNRLHRSNINNLTQTAPSVAAAEKERESRKIAANQADRVIYIASKLKQISVKYHVPIVVLNQTTDMFGSSNPQMDAYQRHQSVYSSGRSVMPAMGLSWSHCVNTRIMLSRDRKHSSIQQAETGVKRELTVTFSDHIPNSSVRYNISTGGICAVDSHLRTSTSAEADEFVSMTPEPFRHTTIHTAGEPANQTNAADQQLDLTAAATVPATIAPTPALPVSMPPLTAGTPMPPTIQSQFDSQFNPMPTPVQRTPLQIMTSTPQHKTVPSHNHIHSSTNHVNASTTPTNKNGVKRTAHEAISVDDSDATSQHKR